MTGLLLTGRRREVHRAGMSALAAVFLVLGVGLSGCGDDIAVDAVSDTAARPLPPSGYAEPGETVSALLSALVDNGWEEAARLIVEGQMALIALTEGADMETVSDYLEAGEMGVGVNFWVGFTQVAEELLVSPVNDLRVVSERRYQAGGVRFADFGLAAPATPESRGFKLTVALGEDQLWRVDVIATFVEVLAYRLSETAEITRATRTEDAAVVSAELMRHVPSLEAALTDPDLTPELSQGVLSALAAIQ